MHMSVHVSVHMPVACLAYACTHVHTLVYVHVDAHVQPHIYTHVCAQEWCLPPHSHVSQPWPPPGWTPHGDIGWHYQVSLMCLS